MTLPDSIMQDLLRPFCETWLQQTGVDLHFEMAEMPIGCRAKDRSQPLLLKGQSKHITYIAVQTEVANKAIQSEKATEFPLGLNLRHCSLAALDILDVAVEVPGMERTGSDIDRGGRSGDAEEGGHSQRIEGG